MKKLILTCLGFFLPTLIFCQIILDWQKCLGGNSNETAYSIKPTSDGGYIIAGFALSNNNGDVMGVHGGGDFWVVKLDGVGAIEWSKTLGGSSTEVAYEIQETTDGGYIVAGKTISNNGDVSGHHGDLDYWVVKLDITGNIEWQKALGGSSVDECYSIYQTTDGGYILAGNSVSKDGDVLTNLGYYDFWVVKLNPNGFIEWQTSLGGGNGAEAAYCVRQTSDNGYIICGESNSTNGDVTGGHGDYDYWVVKLNSIGEIQWQKALGGIGIDQARSVQQTSDKGYMVVGTTGSGNTGQVTGVHGGFDIWVVKLDSIGALQWQKALGGSNQDYGTVVRQLKNGSYAIGGTTTSTNGNVQENDGGQDIWVVILNESGVIQFQKTLGGTDSEEIYALEPTSDNGLILSGYTQSNDGDVSGSHGQKDFWIVKLSLPFTGTATPLSQPLDLFPNPAQQSITIQIPAPSSLLWVTVSDVLGQEMRQQTLSTDVNGRLEIELATWPCGVYIVSARTEDGQLFTGKFVKE